jgi:hypothetical protein
MVLPLAAQRLADLAAEQLVRVGPPLNLEVDQGVKWMSSDGEWVVELVRRTATSNGRDGDWLRVTHCGFKVGEARDWDGVARMGVVIGDLREALGPADGAEPKAAKACRTTPKAASVGS